MDETLTKDRHRVLVNYIRDVADKMGLRDWQFTVEERPETDDDGYMMQTHTWGDSSTATVYVGRSYWKYGPRMQREAVVHELVHWHTDKFAQSAYEVCDNELGREARYITRNMLKRLNELATDGIAAAWARQFPLIDWTDARPIYHEYEGNKDERDPSFD
jgi:hypothetical protein